MFTIAPKRRSYQPTDCCRSDSYNRIDVCPANGVCRLSRYRNLRNLVSYHHSSAVLTFGFAEQRVRKEASAEDDLRIDYEKSHRSDGIKLTGSFRYSDS